MLPTSPRAEARSMCNSCTTPCSSIATRVSWGVTLMRISWVMESALEDVEADFAEDLGGRVQRQPHHSRIAAFDPADEHGGASLHGVRAGLVEGLAGGDVALDLLPRE